MITRFLRIVVSLAVFALAGTATFAQTPASNDSGKSNSANNTRCPTVSFLDEYYIGKEAYFSVSVTGADPKATLAFYWTVSAGSITDGAFTDSIKVFADVDFAEPPTATVRVEGLPIGCQDTFSQNSALPNCVLQRKFDEFGQIRWSDEKARLDNAAIEFFTTSRTKLYLVTYGGRETYVREAERRGRDATDYLVQVRKVPPEKVVVVDGGYRETGWTEIWIWGEDLDPPVGYPTVDPSEITFTKSPPPERRIH